MKHSLILRFQKILQRINRRRLTLLNVSFLGASLVALSLGLLLILTAGRPSPALAQGGVNGAITQTTVADFDSCTVLPGTANRVLTDVVVSHADNGEIRLVPLLEDYFDGATLNASKWDFVDSGYGATGPILSNGVVSFEAAGLRSSQSFTQTPIAIEGRIKFGDDNNTGWADFGFGKFTQVAGPPNILFITDYQGVVWVNSYHSDDSNGPLRHSTSADVTTFQDYRILINDWRTADYYINGIHNRTHNYQPPDYNSPVFTIPAYVWFFTLLNVDDYIYADWLRVAHYEIPTGSYISCAEDAGQIANWTLSWTADLPSNTSLSLRTRTSVDGNTWSPWSDPLSTNGAAVTSPSGRYIQYIADLSTTDLTASPELQSVTLNYFGPSRVSITPTLTILDVGASQQFSGQVYDHNNNPVSSLSYGWSLENGGGNLDDSGRFTATLPAGFYPDTVVVTSMGLTDTATVLAGIEGFEIVLPADGEPGTPFSATIRLLDSPGAAVVVGFTDTITLSTGNGGTISPTQVLIKSGEWQGSLTLSQSGQNREVQAHYHLLTGTGFINIISSEVYLPLILRDIK